MQSSHSQVVVSVGVHRGGRAQLCSEVPVGIGRGLLLQSAVLRRNGIMFRDGQGAGQHEHGGEGGGDGEHHVVLIAVCLVVVCVTWARVWLTTQVPSVPTRSIRL